MERHIVKFVFMLLSLSFSCALAASCDKKNAPEQDSGQPSLSDENQVKDSGDNPSHLKNGTYQM
ncbi:MAG: hypothetical protein IJU23_01800 [Proteobacteria bacterium]|nr:hypothetical protein [Pseudomonadota bacterium]